MDWWLWIILGVVLLGAEMVVPGSLFMLFFGFGALLTGLLAMLGILGFDWLQWGFFAIVSVALLLIFRAKLQCLLDLRGVDRAVDSMVGEKARATSAIDIGGIGKVELRGSSWNAKNVGATTLQIGQDCVVEAVEGLTLIVK